jgi:hypothetical protein
MSAGIERVVASVAGAKPTRLRNNESSQNINNNKSLQCIFVDVGSEKLEVSYQVKI